MRQLKRNVINQADFEEFTTENKYEFRTLTSIVKGMYNIMNKVKDDLEYFQQYDYVFKADVVQIIINKIEGYKFDGEELDDTNVEEKNDCLLTFSRKDTMMKHALNKHKK